MIWGSTVSSCNLATFLSGLACASPSPGTNTRFAADEGKEISFPSKLMQIVLLTLVGPARQVDLKLPAEVPTGTLLPKLLEICGGPQQAQADLSQWRLVIPGKKTVLSPDRSLLDCGVIDGAVLLLQDYASFASEQQRLAQAGTFRPQAISPSASTGGIGVKWNIPNG